MIALKVKQIGEDVVIVLSDEARAALKAEVGGAVYMDRSAEGVLTLQARDASLEARLRRGRGILNRYRKTFEDLAK